MKGGQKIVRENLPSWDAKVNPKAPLTDTQRDAFMELAACAGSRPIPSQLPANDFGKGEREERAVADKAASGDPSKLPMQNTQQFLLWFADIEEQMMQDEDFVYKEREAELGQLLQQVGGLSEQARAARQQLAALKHLQKAAGSQTGALHADCQAALTRQQELVAAADSLSSRLTAFATLDSLQAKLDAPSALSVSAESLLPLLNNLDEAIATLNDNPRWREREVYLEKSGLLLGRLLQLVTHKITTQLQAATQHTEAQQQQSSGEEGEPAAFALFYGKFRSLAPRVRPLIQQLEQRSDRNATYASALEEVGAVFRKLRERLLSPSVTSAVTRLSAQHTTDTCTLTRRGCAFLVHLCEDEAQLYSHFFTAISPALHELLGGLCSQLYDMLRPRLIHIQHVESLAELCAVLKVEMIEDRVHSNPEELGAFGEVCRQLLEDVQERLVYRTHIYVRTEILGYNPAPGDLAYPEKLVMMQNIAQEQEEKRRKTLGQTDTGAPESLDAAIGSTMPRSAADLHGMWYPTVRRTLLCLSKLYRCVNRQAFEGVAQEALSTCIQTLVSASQHIEKSKGWLDARLFLIKHLLIMREQLAPFHADFSVRETQLDFTRIKDAAYGLLHKKSQMFVFNRSNAFLEFLLEGTPGVREEVRDSRRAVDTELRDTCQLLITGATDTLLGPLQRLFKQVDSLSAMRGAREMGLKQQPWAAPRALHEAVGETLRLLRHRLAPTLAAMALYLANRDTERILFKPIKTSIETDMGRLRQLVAGHYTTEEAHVIAAPSQDQISLLLASSLPSRPPAPQEAALPTPQAHPTSTPSQDASALASPAGTAPPHVPTDAAVVASDPSVFAPSGEDKEAGPGAVSSSSDLGNPVASTVTGGEVGSVASQVATPAETVSSAAVTAESPASTS